MKHSCSFCMLLLFILAAYMPRAEAQNACKTVNPGSISASCEQTGAKCDAGSGAGTGRCAVIKQDGACECISETHPPPPQPTPQPTGAPASACLKSGGASTVVACTRDGLFKAELETWDRNLIAYSSAGAELRTYKWTGSAWKLNGPTDAVINNEFTGVVPPSGGRGATRLQHCGPTTPSLTGKQKSAKIQCFIWSIGGSVSLNASASSGLPDTTPAIGNPGVGRLPQLSVATVMSSASLTVDGERLGLGPSHTP